MSDGYMKKVCGFLLCFHIIVGYLIQNQVFTVVLKKGFNNTKL